MYYPVLFKPIYKEMLWGGTRMQTLYGRTLPFKNTGESWDISCRPNEMGIIENGPDAGMRFQDYIDRDPVGVLGMRLAARLTSFPLLIKIIDANADLSVQVHPGDAYAKRQSKMDTGKSEVWYIMEAPESGKLIIGLQSGTTRSGLEKSCEEDDIEKQLCYLPVKKGDLIDIPAGLVHGLTKGVIVTEVQQNSDTTYRLYDYKRIGLDGKLRELHIEKSLEVINFSGSLPQRITDGNTIVSNYYQVEKYNLQEPIQATSDPGAFCVFTCVEGECEIAAEKMTVQVPVSRSVFIPAGLGRYVVRGKAVVVKSLVP